MNECKHENSTYIQYKIDTDSIKIIMSNIKVEIELNREEIEFLLEAFTTFLNKERK
jgi:vesicle coat complex subunit